MTLAPRCDECGAPLVGGAACRDHFHALLALEAGIPGMAGALPHFHAVASYQLQHPRGMGLAVASHAQLLRAVADSVSGRATLEEIRRRVRRDADGPARVRRRDGEPAPGQPRGEWPVTVTDVLAVEPMANAYAEAVARWARSIVELLDPGSLSPDPRRP